MKGESGTFSLNMFTSTIASTIDKILTDPALNELVPPEVANEFKTYNLRLSYLEVLESKVNEAELDNPSFTPICKHRDVLKIKLDGIDWSTFSKVYDDNMPTLLDMTPLRIFDINKVSGRTPAINNFLDSTSSSSSGIYYQQLGFYTEF